MESEINFRIVRITGTFGLIACVIGFVEFPLWFVSETMPKFWEATAFSEFVAQHSTLYITRTFMDLFIFGLLIFFFGGFRYLIVKIQASYEWLATIFFGIALVYTAITLISDAFTATMALDTIDGKADPTVIRALNESTLLLFGSVAEILVATMLLVAGILIYYTKALPRWTVWLAFITAAVNLAFIPSMYFGTDFTKYYSVAGDGPGATAPFMFVIWIFTTAIYMMRKH